MKKLIGISLVLISAVIIASCEGAGKQNNVEKNVADTAAVTNADSIVQTLSAKQIEDGKAWLENHVAEALKQNVTDASPARTVTRIETQFSKESNGQAVYLVSGNMQNGTEFSYEFCLAEEGSAYVIEATDAPKFFY